MFFLMLQMIENEEDRSKMAAFYLKYHRLLKMKARDIMQKFGISDEADLSDDLLHDAMAKILQNMHTISNFNDFQLLAYASKAVQSCSIDYCKKVIRDQKAMQEKGILEGDLIIEEDPTRKLGESDFVIQLGKILALLSGNDRNILLYKYFLNYSDTQIAELIGIQPDSVRMALTRARRKVRELWKQKEGIVL